MTTPAKSSALTTVLWIGAALGGAYVVYKIASRPSGASAPSNDAPSSQGAATALGNSLSGVLNALSGVVKAVKGAGASTPTPDTGGNAAPSDNAPDDVASTWMPVLWSSPAPLMTRLRAVATVRSHPTTA